MKNRIKKIIWSLLILIIIFSINTKVLAWSGIISDAQDFINEGESSNVPGVNVDEDLLKETSGFLYNILLSAGVVIAVIIATILGIQFMLGGAEGQAKVKEMLVPFIVGCIVVFGGFGFWKIAVTIGRRIENVDGSAGTSSSSSSSSSSSGSGQSTVHKDPYGTIHGGGGKEF